jgi:hypothetical protein
MNPVPLNSLARRWRLALFLSLPIVPIDIFVMGTNLESSSAHSRKLALLLLILFMIPLICLVGFGWARWRDYNQGPTKEKLLKVALVMVFLAMISVIGGTGVWLSERCVYPGCRRHGTSEVKYTVEGNSSLVVRVVTRRYCETHVHLAPVRDTLKSGEYIGQSWK